tara:strand:- start:15870 stop:17942 length:2073 start_codon:yes stop_codon:yes gene_type:complete
MLQIEYPFAIIGLLGLSLMLAVFIYRKDARFSSAKPYAKFSLIFLRFFSLTILCLLLLKSKWLNEVKKIEKPIIAILQDASSSILNYNDSIYYKNDFRFVLEENIKQLSGNFEIHNFHFDKNIHEGLSDKYKGSYTDIGQAFQSVEDRFHNRNIAAVILASDGNYNLGMNPLYNTEEMNIPVFTLAVGDSSQAKDISIESIRHNEIAYFENEFPVQFDLLSNFNSEQSHLLSITNNGNKIYEEWVNIKNQSPISKQIYIEASQEGIQYFEIEISSFEGEKNTKNNRHKIAIEVLNNLQNILILASSPHPDVAALKESLEEGKNYKVRSELFYNFTDEIESYNLIILHQIPDYTNRNITLFNKIIKSQSALFYICGNATDWTKFNQQQQIVEIKYENSMQEVFASINKGFSPFELSTSCKYFIENAPPLLAPFGEVSPKNIDYSLLKQQIEDINTNQNLLFFSESEQRQYAILLAEGLWKWKFYDFQENKSHKNFTEWTQSVVQYLTLNRDKRKLRLQYQKLLHEGEKFKIQAQLYNESYQMVETAELNLLLINELGTEYRYSLNPKNRKYEKTINSLEKGDYRFKLSASYKDILIEQEGEFAVLNSQLEQQKLQANWRTLMRISDKSNGLFIKKNEFTDLAQIIDQNVTSSSKIYFNKYLTDLIKKKSLFLVLLLSLFIEWAWRKTLGTH